MTTVRSLEAPVAADLRDRMVFVAGPRQVGKTTLARSVLAGWPAGTYLNWDHRANRRTIRAAEWPGGDDVLVVLDELHKLRGWKGWLKGEFDAHRARVRFLVTGSARMDVVRRGGDSLQGRYHHVRLHPFSVAEVEGGGRLRLPEPGAPVAVPAEGASGGVAAILAALFEYGGFPEPFLAQSARVHRRWQKERLERFFREDVRDLEAVRDLARLELMADALPGRVGSPLSLNALREDLEVSHRAVTHWMDVLDRLCHTFRIRPHGGPLSRTLTRMPKAYVWDWSLVPDRGPRFENLVASHLLKFCHALEDMEGHAVELRYVRDKDGHETDFLVTWKRKPWFLVEAKVAEEAPDPSLVLWRERLGVSQAYQVSLEGTRDYVRDGVRVLPAARFLAALA